MPGGKGKLTGADGRLFVKGDPRINRLGRPKRMSLDRLLRKVLMEKVNNATAVKGILMKLRDMALDGDIRAAEFLLDRAYGKPKHAALPPSGPVAIIGIQYITPGNGDSNKTDDETTRSVECVEVE